MLGTRGAPARYGGFETAVEEIGWRLVERGHDITVYCRRAPTKAAEYRGMRLVHLPAPRMRTAETLGHTGLSALHCLGRRPDVAFVFNAANAPLLPLLRIRGIPRATHVDGLEWKRDKWGRFGRRYYLVCERLAVRWSTAVIADAQGIQDHYHERYGAAAELIAYGAPAVDDPDPDALGPLGLEAHGYHLVVARLEPENHVHTIIEGFSTSPAAHDLVVVGSAPYAKDYTRHLTDLASRDARVRMLGGIWDGALLDQLYANALTYLHGHSVGGTNPSLLRAMGAGAPVLAWDVSFNREVAGDCGRYFSDPAEVARLVAEAENEPLEARRRGAQGKASVVARYDWDKVTDAYEELAERLAWPAR